ncbi:MAG: NUDIX hydrolase [Pyrinomonadaceae bacterium]|nr:NUDIX hydrolase [Pyrinomonadaceae bacterium]
MCDEEKSPWQTVSSRVVYDNPWIRVREDAVIRPDKEPGIYGVVHYKNTAIGILAVEGEDIYLVGQYRYTLGQYSWEIPEGGCAEGEEHLAAAKRELEEETGLQAKRWTKLGEAHLSNSVSDELAVWYLATDLIKGVQQPEGTEQLIIRRVPVIEALQMALTGKITDAISLMAIFQYHLLSGGRWQRALPKKTNP